MSPKGLAIAIGLTAGLVLVFFGNRPAQADRDIVYAARYYAPPGSRRTSHFHLYRINPDGTGKTQLTFGSGDEGEAKWTPDGRRITFVARAGPAGPDTLCEISAGGGRRRVLRGLADASPAEAGPVLGYRLENEAAESSSAPDRHVLIDRKTGQRQALAVPAHDDLNDALLPMPGRGLVYAANAHNSTVGTDYLFYRLNPETKALHYLTEGQFLAWSPDGANFCTAPGRDTTAYDGRRLVWSAPLYVRAAAGGPMRPLTPRLSWVTGADWRTPPLRKPL